MATNILLRANLLHGSATKGTVNIEGGPATAEFTARVDYSQTLNPTLAQQESYVATFPAGTTTAEVAAGLMAAASTFTGVSLSSSPDPDGVLVTFTANAGKTIGHLDTGRGPSSAAPSTTPTTVTVVGACPINYIQPDTIAQTANTTIPQHEACDGGPRRFGY